MSTSLLGDAFAHHIWATERLIDACASLSPNQLEGEAPGTYGPIIETFRHLVHTDTWYLSFFGGGPALPDEEVDHMSLADLRSVITKDGAAWMELLAGDIDADADVEERDDEWEIHSPVGLRLAQVVHHGTDHRSQICTAMTSLGIEPPEIDVWAFGRATGREHGRKISPA